MYTIRYITNNRILNNELIILYDIKVHNFLYLSCQQNSSIFFLHETISQLFVDSSAQSVKPNPFVRLHKFKGLRGRRQACPCTVTKRQEYHKNMIVVELFVEDCII